MNEINLLEIIFLVNGIWIWKSLENFGLVGWIGLYFWLIGADMYRRAKRPHVYFITNLCGGVEAEAPYFFKESEHHSSLIGSLFFKQLLINIVFITFIDFKKESSLVFLRFVSLLDWLVP